MKSTVCVIIGILIAEECLGFALVLITLVALGVFDEGRKK
jgi:hypothetical protein